MTLLIYLYITR